MLIDLVGYFPVVKHGVKEAFTRAKLTLCFYNSRTKISKINSSPHPQWLRLLSVLRRWFCCCLFFVYCCSYCLWGCIVSLVCYAIFLYFLVFSIISLGEGRADCFTFIVLLMSCFALFPAVPCVGRQCVSVAFPGHSHLLFLSVRVCILAFVSFSLSIVL